MIRKNANRSYQLGFMANRRIEAAKLGLDVDDEREGSGNSDSIDTPSESSFAKALAWYIAKKLKRMGLGSFYLSKALSKFAKESKSYVVRNIFLGRGVLYKPLFQSGIAVMTIALVVTGVLNGLSFTEPRQGVVFASEQDMLTEVGSVATNATESDIRLDVEEHIVKPGETLSTIAEYYEIDVATIKWANGMDETQEKISPGQKLTILPVEGVLHIVAEGDNLNSIANKYSASVQAIADWNWLDAPDFKVYKGDKLIIPGGKVAPKPKPVIATKPKTTVSKTSSYQTGSAGDGIRTGNFGRAVEPGCGYLSQGFKRWHKAVDIAQKGGCKELAIDGGTITTAGWTAYGFAVFIDHGNGWTSRYGHGTGTFYVKVGQKVSKGDPVQYMGCTGRCTGTHLHLEIYYNGVAQDPARLIVMP